MSNRITSPFGYRTTARDVVKGVDLSGVNAIVTGASSGIGIETAAALAEAGARVTLAVRNTSAGETVASAINAKAAKGRAQVEALDLSSLASVAAFAGRVRATDAPLHLLINNAGVMACPLERTADGFEMQFGTNHLGHFALTVGVLPALVKGAQDRKRPSRVVSLSSIGHRRSGIHWDDPNYTTRPYDRFEAYGQAKTANALFAVGVTRKFAGQGVLSNAVMPGGIITGLQKHMPREEMMALGWVDAEGKPNPRMKNAEEGAATSVWAATGKELEEVGGLYLEDCAQAVPWTEENPWQGVLPHALNPADADRLWMLSEQITGVRA